MEQIIQFVTREEIIKWTMDMVSIPSYSGLPNQEAEVGRYIESVFRKEGIDCQYVPLKDGRCNVIATLKGTGGGKSLLFNGHMDTVPAYGMDKAYEPWIDGDGNIHGRGTSDMKGPIAAMMAMMIAIKRSGVSLKGDLIFTAVADEEEGSLGCIDLLETGIKADAAIVGEPLGLTNIGSSQKGLEWFQFDFKGRTVHGGAYREGVNAILMATRFIEKINSELAPEIAARIHPIAGESTMNIGVIHGGTQLSTVAGECYVQLDRRFLPEMETYEDCCAELQAVIDQLAAEDPRFKCEMKVLEASVMDKGYVHQGFVLKPDDLLVQTMQAAVSQALHIEAKPTPVPFWTDGGLLAHYGNIPVLVYAGGDMANCHSVHEFIAIDDLINTFKVYITMAMMFCNEDPLIRR